jgi:hypothetical protein
MKCKQLVMAGSLVLAAQGVAADTALDTSKLLVCAATQVAECTATGECDRATPETFNLPVLFQIDIASKVVESARAGGNKRVSVISGVTEAGHVTVLQGVDEADGWSSTVNRSTGQMTVVSAADGLGYVVFGTCANL